MARTDSHQHSGPSDFDPFYFTGMTSDANFNRAAADLTVFDGRKTPLRRVGARRKDRPAERTSHLDLFFEVHEKSLARKAGTTRSFFRIGRFFSANSHLTLDLNPACGREVRGPWCRRLSAMSQRGRRRGERRRRMPRPAPRSACLRAENPSEAGKRDSLPT